MWESGLNWKMNKLGKWVGVLLLARPSWKPRLCQWMHVHLYFLPRFPRWSLESSNSHPELQGRWEVTQKAAWSLQVAHCCFSCCCDFCSFSPSEQVLYVRWASDSAWVHLSALWGVSGNLLWVVNKSSAWSQAQRHSGHPVLPGLQQDDPLMLTKAWLTHPNMALVVSVGRWVRNWCCPCTDISFQPQTVRSGLQVACTCTEQDSKAGAEEAALVSPSPVQEKGWASAGAWGKWEDYLLGGDRAAQPKINPNLSLQLFISVWIRPFCPSLGLGKYVHKTGFPPPFQSTEWFRLEGTSGSIQSRL